MAIHTALEGLGHKSADHFPPVPNTAAFRDLLIFEERLKQNAARLKNRKHKYQGAYTVLHLTRHSFPRMLVYVHSVHGLHGIT